MLMNYLLTLIYISLETEVEELDIIGGKIPRTLNIHNKKYDTKWFQRKKWDKRLECGHYK